MHSAGIPPSQKKYSTCSNLHPSIRLNLNAGMKQLITYVLAVSAVFFAVNAGMAGRVAAAGPRDNGSGGNELFLTGPADLLQGPLSGCFTENGGSIPARMMNPEEKHSFCFGDKENPAGLAEPGEAAGYIEIHGDLPVRPLNILLIYPFHSFF